MENTNLTFYRYEGVKYAPLDSEGDYVASSFISINIVLKTYGLIKETPCGYWIGQPNIMGRGKWVSKTSIKKYAYLSKKEALESFISRYSRWYNILSQQREFCQIALSQAKSIITALPETLDNNNT